MILRNIIVRVISLGVSLVFMLAAKFMSKDANAVSVSIMLTSLFFGVLRSGLAFGTLSNSTRTEAPGLNFTFDKAILILLVFLYSLHLGATIEQTVYTLFAASAITLIYRKNYAGYTNGSLTHSLALSLVFPAQVSINMTFDYLHPDVLIILLCAGTTLYFSYDRYLTSSHHLEPVELYHSMLLPIGGFTAISIDGIDKPLYMIASKMIDSASSLASFLIQGDLTNSRAYITKHNPAQILVLAAGTNFIVGSLMSWTASSGTYKAIAATLLINVCWLIYSAFIISILINLGARASDSIYRHMLLLAVMTFMLAVLGHFEPAYIVLAISGSFVLAMLTTNLQRHRQRP